MQFDVFTFIATIVNFLVIVALLRIFLYKRIVGAIDEREQKIKDRWERAETEKQEAARKAEEYEKRRDTIESERQKIISKAETEAEERKRSLLEDAREDVNRQKQEWVESLRQEQNRFLAEFRRDTGRRLVEVLQSVLGDLADVGLEEKIADRFTHLLRNLDEEERAALCEALASSPAEVRTGREISQETKSSIADAVHEISADCELRFEVDSELVAGVALVTPERELRWAVGDYVEDLGGALRDNVAAL